MGGENTILDLKQQIQTHYPTLLNVITVSRRNETIKTVPTFEQALKFSSVCTEK